MYLPLIENTKINILMNFKNSLLNNIKTVMIKKNKTYTSEISHLFAISASITFGRLHSKFYFIAF